MRYLVAILLVALAAVSIGFEMQRRAANALADEKDQAAIAAIAAKRSAAEADTKGRQEIAKWKAASARHEAEVKRLRGAAGTAAKKVKAVVKAGETLVASGTTDEIIAALRARGYSPVRCRPVPALR